jgi:spore germination cell wall hydrolase CwlJ-like protein
MKAICVLAVWAFVCVTPAAASGYYDFRSSEAEFTSVPAHALTAQDRADLMCLARNIYHEARGQSEYNQKAVAWVTRNRVQITNRSYCAVVFESRRVGNRRVGQFSWTVLRHVRRMERPAWDQAQRLAWHVMHAPQMHDITSGATHFYDRNAPPEWRRAGVNARQIGAHVFMRLPEYAQAHVR